ncbi:MAG: hypothetical protein FJY99_06915 [Candidatus Sericytochromatia bacterium]|nr:hypothetical protein [Candidatus Tanganyikabacteria bacterium]
MRRHWWASRVVLATLAAGCDAAGNLPGLGTQVLSGTITGAAIEGLKVGILKDVPFPEDLPKAEVVQVAADGAFRYAIPTGVSNLTVFAFRDANGNGRYDAGEANSYSGCTACSYLQVVRVGEQWTVQAVGGSGTQAQGLGSARIAFAG